MSKLWMLLGAMGLLVGGCAAPMADTAVDNPPSSYVGTNGPASGTPAKNATLDPSRDELNHTGTAQQNGGSGAPSGATGNSAPQ